VPNSGVLGKSTEFYWFSVMDLNFYYSADVDFFILPVAESKYSSIRLFGPLLRSRQKSCDLGDAGKMQTLSCVPG
jgi:hypothetical protein